MSKRGAIWQVNLDPTVGSEIQKTRPVVIVSVNELRGLPVRIVVPITGWKDKYNRAKWIVRMEPDARNGLTKTSGADALQVRCVSEERFVRRMGDVPADIMDRVDDALARVLGL